MTLSLPIHVPANFRGTDLGNAYVFLNEHGHHLRYLADVGTWAVWNSPRWVLDFQSSHINALIQRTAVRLSGEQDSLAAQLRTINAAIPAAGAADPALIQQRDSLAARFAAGTKELAGFTNAARTRAMKESAASVVGIAVHCTSDVFDTHPELVTARNGVVDLRDGSVAEVDPLLCLTQMVDADYRPDAGCPRWVQFLEEVFAGDQTVIRYVQQLVGLSISGRTGYHLLLMLAGRGANGKSLFLSTLENVFAELSGNFTPEVLLETRNESISNGLASLRGCRFVSTGELPENARLAESSLKSFTGEDTVKARFLHKEYFSFVPHFTPWMATNHLPLIRGTDNGIWRRIKVINFTRMFKESEQDQGLRAKLIAEADGIFAWAVRGAVDLAEHGLIEPASVTDAVLAYRQGHDTIQRFLDEACTASVATVAGKKVFTHKQALYAGFQAWCASEGLRYKISAPNFLERLASRGYPCVRTKEGHFRVYGISFTEPHLRDPLSL